MSALTLPDDLRAITMGAEYAALIAAGIKGHETRGQRCNYRGPVAIHAGRFADGLPIRWFAGQEGGAFILDGRAYLGVSGSGPFMYTTDGRMPHQRLHVGAIVAVANLVDCLPICGHGELPAKPGLFIEDTRTVEGNRLWLCRLRLDGGVDTVNRVEDQRPYGIYLPGRYALLLEDVTRLPEPVPARGNQPVPWRVPDDVAAKVREQIGGAS